MFNTYKLTMILYVSNILCCYIYTLNFIWLMLCKVSEQDNELILDCVVYKKNQIIILRPLYNASVTFISNSIVFSI